MTQRPLLCAAALLLAALPTRAQDTFVDRRPGLSEALAQAETHIPGRRLGVRAGLVRRARTLIPDVVIVRDEASYLRALAAWTPDAIFPVLWDDGSEEAHDHIARFVRAFQPRSVVEFLDDQDPGDREASIRQAWGAGVGAPPEATGAELRDALGLTPPGIVVTSPIDPAWPGALALAAGRFQPLLMIDRPRGSIGGAMSVPDSDALARQIEQGAEATGLVWKRQGDDLDALTLCMNVPLMIRTAEQPRTHVALSDRLGRLGASGGGDRWAWCGQLIGRESQSVYRAMCALFLETNNAWLFDTYPPTSEWAAFDASVARDILDQAGMEITLHDTPRNDRSSWRLGTLHPLDAGLVLVNTKGRPTYFEFGSVRAAGGDVPILNNPAIVHFVHSFSLALPASRNAIGPRWLERGAYAYLGSVQEPYLQAFVPTPALAARLVSGFAWGAGARLDSGPVWKLALLGDPLITLSPAGVRLDRDLPLPNARAIHEDLPTLLKEGRFERALRVLTRLGRDPDAARLALGLLADRPEAFSPGVARAALPALARQREHTGALQAARRIPDLDNRPVLLDLAWFSARAAIATGSAPNEGISFMRSHVRTPQLLSDAEEIGMALKPLGGGRSAAAFITSLSPQARNDRERATLERLATEFETGKR
jgi:hypothetical protein